MGSSTAVVLSITFNYGAIACKAGGFQRVATPAGTETMETETVLGRS
jgi:hypothetical protein